MAIGSSDKPTARTPCADACFDPTSVTQESELMGGSNDLTRGDEAYAALEAELERLKTVLAALA
jgi:hypothetical protein